MAQPTSVPQVKSRIPTALLMGQKLPGVAEADCAVRRLVAGAGPTDRHAFVRFMQAREAVLSCDCM